MEEIYKRGTTLIRTTPSPAEVKLAKKHPEEVKEEEPSKKEIIKVHEDLIEKPAFYDKYDLLKKLE